MLCLRSLVRQGMAYPFVYKLTAFCSVLVGSVTSASGRPGVLETKLMTSSCGISLLFAAINEFAYTEAISSLRAPEVDNVIHSVTNLRVIPVEVRLRRCEEMQIYSVLRVNVHKA